MKEFGVGFVLLWLALVLLSLGGCASVPPAEPVNVTVAGPHFPVSAFDCALEPLPPNPKSVGSNGGSAAAHYENSERGWGRGCQRKLQSVGTQLRAAGQVVDPFTPQAPGR